MKKRSREFNIFSMSALDLFASALGAFILITVILFPYFPNTGDSPERVAEVRAEMQAQIDTAEMELEQKDDRIDSLEEQLEAEEERAASLEGRLEEALSEARRTGILGIQSDAKRFVIVLDMSGSMNDTQRHDYDPAQHDFRGLLQGNFEKLLSDLENDVEIAIVGFHAPNLTAQLHTWPTGGGYAALSASNRQQAIRELERMMSLVEGGTPTRAALLKALERNPEAIIMFSDGAPTIPENLGWQEVVSQVTAANTENVEIHSVAIGPYWESSEFVRFLGRLTARNNGDLVAAIP